VQDVLSENLDASALGPRVLTNAQWSDLGRFVVSHRPADIGAFRTPSLRNVAVTAPYMHDGSIVTLEAAVDHEIYYRGFSSGHPINLTQAERNAIVAFLESLTDAHIDAAKTQSRGSSKP
jgi:cytochrome c peroxidase